MVVFSKDRILQDIQEKLLPGAVVLSFVFAGIGSYDYYKYFFWPVADSVVDSIEPRCVFSKARFYRGTYTEHLNCDDKEGAAKLVADGYSRSGISNRIRVVYEAEAGRKTYAILSSWPAGVGPLTLGAIVRVRYSPSTPSRAEPAGDPDNSVFITSGVILLLAICGRAILQGRRREKPPPQELNSP